jgi:hypothetical protein
MSDEEEVYETTIVTEEEYPDGTTEDLILGGVEEQESAPGVPMTAEEKKRLNKVRLLRNRLAVQVLAIDESLGLNTAIVTVDSSNALKEAIGTASAYDFIHALPALQDPITERCASLAGEVITRQEYWDLLQELKLRYGNMFTKGSSKKSFWKEDTIRSFIVEYYNAGYRIPTRVVQQLRQKDSLGEMVPEEDRGDIYWHNKNEYVPYNLKSVAFDVKDGRMDPKNQDKKTARLMEAARKRQLKAQQEAAAAEEGDIYVDATSTIELSEDINFVTVTKAPKKRRVKAAAIPIESIEV